MKYNPLLKQGFESLGTTGTLGVGRVLFIQNNSSASTNSNLYWNNTLNRLGIGTTNPQYNLDIASVGNPGFNLTSLGPGGKAFTIYSTDSSASIGPGTLTFYDNTLGLHLFRMSGALTTILANDIQVGPVTAGNARISMFSSGAGARQYAFIVTNNSASIGGSKLSIFDGSANQHRVILDSLGNLGIGTALPSARLDVNGDIAQPISNFHYYGNPNTNGSVRTGVVGTDFVVQVRQAGIWVTKGTTSLL